MDVGSKDVSALRVVVLTPENHPLGPQVGHLEGLAVVRAANPYEAAAELLAGPAAALVVDLRTICPRHAGLFEVARRMQIPVLAHGTVPSQMHQALDGVRLVEPDRLPAELRQLAERQVPAPQVVRLTPAKLRPPSPAPRETRRDEPGPLLDADQTASLLEDRQ